MQLNSPAGARCFHEPEVSAGSVGPDGNRKLVKKYLEEEEMSQKINQHAVKPIMVLVWTQAKKNRTPNDPENTQLSRPRMGT